MTVLITDKYNVYIPEIYGVDTWGDGYRQDYLGFEKGKWIISSWQYGGEFEEDSYYENELPVIAQFNSVYKAKVFLKKEGHKEKIRDLLILEEIYINFSKSCKKSDKELKKREKRG